MGIRISSLSANALPYTGREQIPVVQNATTRAGTLSSFVNYLSGDFAFVNRPNTFIGSQTIQGNLSVLGNQTIQGNLSVQNTLSATMVQAVSARFDSVDIRQFESSGFDIRGNLNVIGRLSATDIVNFNSGLTARDAVLFDVDTSAPALEITQRGSGYSLLVEDELNDTTPFAITNSGNVGVGTSTPNEKLTVFGNLSVSGTLSATMIEAVSSRITYLDIREYELSGFRATGPVIIETNSSDTTLRITQSGSGDVIRVEDSHAIDMTPFIVKGDGKVGIGVSTPNELLTVAGNISAYGNVYAFNTLSTPTGNSVNWDKGYTAYNGLTALSANWQSTYTTMTANSGRWDSSRNTVNTLSSTWDKGYTAYNGLTALSANWQSTYTTMTANSANWQNAYNARAYTIAPLSSIIPVNGENFVSNSIFSNILGGTINGIDLNSWVVIGGGSNNFIYESTHSSILGGSANTLSSSNYSSILGGRENIIEEKDNAHIIGSSITAPLSNYTYVNNISSQGIVESQTGNSIQWSSNYSTVQANSANWNGSGVFDNSDTTILLTLSDAYDYIRLTNVSPITIQVPVASWTIGTPITFRRTTNAGAITLSAGNGITINDNNATSVLSGETFVIKYIATNTWDFI
jgi:hypothetical protein